MFYLPLSFSDCSTFGSPSAPFNGSPLGGGRRPSGQYVFSARDSHRKIPMRDRNITFVKFGRRDLHVGRVLEGMPPNVGIARTLGRFSIFF